MNQLIGKSKRSTMIHYNVIIELESRILAKEMRHLSA